MALTPWKDPSWFQSGVDLRMVSRRKVVLTDASNADWGALCKGRPTSSSKTASYQLPDNASSLSGPQNLPARSEGEPCTEGAPCLSPIGQDGSGVNGPSVKRVGDVQALSVSASCLEFWPNDCKVVFKH